MSKERLLRLKRFNIHNNGMVNKDDGKMCLYSEVYDLLRDETAGANVITHKNPNPDGNEADGYLCITSDKLNMCFTEKQIADAIQRFDKKPWLPKPKPAPKRKAKKKVAKVEPKPARNYGGAK